MAVTLTVPTAVRLGRRADVAGVQARLARSVCRDHLISFGCMLTFVALWVAHAV
jgi:hypothetical protein